jgi:hypothetical protein
MKTPIVSTGNGDEQENPSSKKKLDMSSAFDGEGTEAIPPPLPSYVPSKEKKKQRKVIEVALAKEGKDCKKSVKEQEQAASSGEDHHAQ